MKISPSLCSWSDVIFAVPEFQHEVLSSNLDACTFDSMEDLKNLATHSRDLDRGVDRPSDATKQALGIPLHNREPWPVLLARVQNNNTAFFEYIELRRKEDMLRWSASSRPRCLLEVLIDLVELRMDFTVAPWNTVCSCCLLSKFATPTALFNRMAGGCMICEDCVGLERERRFIRKFSSHTFVDGI
jgi:hypothetical protein